MNNKPEKLEWEEFKSTRTLHHEGITCFDDALAWAYIDRYIAEQISQAEQAINKRCNEECEKRINKAYLEGEGMVIKKWRGAIKASKSDIAPANPNEHNKDNKEWGKAEEMLNDLGVEQTTPNKVIAKAYLSQAKNTPMGLSTWKAHGEKCGYWLYYEADVYKFAKKQGREEALREADEIVTEKIRYYSITPMMKRPTGYSVLSEVQKELSQLTNKDK